MALGDGEAQEEAAAADGGDRLAGQHHGAARDRHGQHAAVAGGDDSHLGLLLHHDRALGLARSKLVAGDVDGGTKLVEPLRRRHPTLDQGFAAVSSVSAVASWDWSARICASRAAIWKAILSSRTVARCWPSVTLSPSLTARSTTMPPMRARAGTVSRASTRP